MKKKLSKLSRIVADFSFFGRGYVRNAVGLFFAIIFPVILILIFGAIFSGGFGGGSSTSGPITAYVQNLDLKWEEWTGEFRDFRVIY